MSKEPTPNKDALKLRLTKSNMTVCTLHYAADEYKNPQNEVGREWMRAALSGYAEGVNDPRWLREMEIQYGAGSGQKIFPDWQKWQTSSNIFIDGYIDIRGAKLYGSYDHGYANPACYLVHAIYPDNLKRTIWEFYGPGVEVPWISKIINGEDVKLPDGRTYRGNPYAGKELFKVCDPEIMRKSQVMAQGPNKSIAWMFTQNNVYFIAGEKGDDATVANWLKGNLWLSPNEPGYQIHRDCRHLTWELGMLQNRPLSPLMSRTRNAHETMIDKDNHAWDALKYWLKRFPVGAPEPVSRPKEADFNYWMNLDKQGGRVKQSYMREFAK